MNHLYSFSIFENKKEPAEHPDGVEFQKALSENNFWSNTAREWFKFFYKRTGRISLHGADGCNMPSGSYIQKDADGTWKLWYESAGWEYGSTFNKDPIKILEELVKDAIKKNAPRYLNKKEIQKATDPDNEEWLKGAVSERISDLYPKLKNFALTNTNIIKDFSKIRTPLMNSLYDKGVISEIKGGDSGELSILFTQMYPENNLLSIISNIIYPPPHGKRNLVYTEKGVLFIPGGKGKKVSSGKSSYVQKKVDLGYKTEDEIKREMDKTILNLLGKGKFAFDESDLRIKPEIMDEIFDSYIRSDEQFEHTVDVILIKYIKENPFKIHLLDKFPDLKNRILKKIGIRDISKISRLIDLGIL